MREGRREKGRAQKSVWTFGATRRSDGHAAFHQNWLLFSPSLRLLHLFNAALVSAGGVHGSTEQALMEKDLKPFFD